MHTLIKSETEAVYGGFFKVPGACSKGALVGGMTAGFFGGLVGGIPGGPALMAGGAVLGAGVGAVAAAVACAVDMRSQGGDYPQCGPNDLH